MMKKNSISLLSALLIAVVVLVSCSKKSEYINVIPADAQLVASVDLESMCSKSGMADNASAMQKMGETLKANFSGQSLQYMEKLLKDPSQSGVSVKEKLYMFAFGLNEGFGMVAKVDDASKLEEAFKILQSEGGTEPLSSVDGYWQTVIDNQFVCAFNESTLLFLGMPEMEETKNKVKELFALKPEQCIHSNKGFEKLNEKKSDVSVYLSMGMFPAVYTDQMKMMMPDGVEMKDIQLLSTLNFEKGKVALAVEYYSENEQVNKFYEDQREAYRKIGEGFLANIPQSSMFYFGMNVKGDKMQETLSKQPAFTEMTRLLGMDISPLIGSIDGKVAYAVTGVSQQGMPSFVFYAEVKNEEIMKTLSSVLGGNKQGENSYLISMGSISARYGMDGKVFFVKMGEGADKGVEKLPESLENAEWASQVKDSYTYVVANISEVLGSPLMGVMGGAQIQMLAPVFSQFDYLELASSDHQNVNINLVMKNKDENSLKAIFDLAAKLAGGN